MASGTAGIRTKPWHPSLAKKILAGLVYPLFLLLNRPSMRWFGDLIYDFALRCSGMAITFPGKLGLTACEEHFLARHAGAFDNGILLDIGANHGAYANCLAALAPNARIVAFEPHPRTFGILQTNTAHNANIETINQAVSDLPGTRRLHDFAAEDGSTQASLSADAVALFTPDIVTHEVECTTLDQFIKDAGIERIDLLKIDTEGHDLLVLKGAREALRDRRIHMIQFEFIPANIATGSTMRGFFEVLTGYRIHRLCLNGDLWPLDTYDTKRCEIFVTQNLIATLLPAPRSGR